MSRAFVNEDKAVEDLPDRPVSTHPNYVTKKGLTLIDSALENARREHAEAQAHGDRAGLAKAGRELRYWSARRASAQLVEAKPNVDTVQFGNTVTIVDGREQIFKIVGEDEADPSQGTISHVSRPYHCSDERRATSSGPAVMTPRSSPSISSAHRGFTTRRANSCSRGGHNLITRDPARL